jgi:acetylornithine deacetylase/succinyl-diaminopimelate desuccinylase-like protein
VIALSDEQTLAIGYLKIEYPNSATNETVVEIFDEAESTSSGNLSDIIEKFALSPGDRVVVSEPFLSEIENDLVAAADGNSDAQVHITAGGPLITG